MDHGSTNEDGLVYVPFNRLVTPQHSVLKSGVEYFKNLYLSGSEVPPPKVTAYGGMYILSDGNHRCRALRELGVEGFYAVPDYRHYSKIPERDIGSLIIEDDSFKPRNGWVRVGI